MIWDASKAVSNQAKEGIGGKMLAAFGSDNRHSTPPREGIKWFPREGYCRMEVYEKAIWISRGVLGFIALRELLNDDLLESPFDTELEMFALEVKNLIVPVMSDVQNMV